MRNKIADFIVRTQKATAALLMAATAVSAATWLPIPDPWSTYVATAIVVLTWVVTYAVPFVAKAVEAFPFEEFEDDDEGLTGEIIEPETDEIPVPRQDTEGIPVIEGESAEFVPPFTGALRVEDVLRRLATERA